MANRKKIDYLDVFRCVAILAVVAIHTTSQPVTQLSLDRWLYRLSYVINTGSQFAVPAFLFLSGMILTYNYEPKWNRDMMKSFFRKRLQYIIAPYFIWSFFYFLYVSMSSSVPLLSFKTWAIFIFRFLTGNNYFHLYFILVIFQFYILFPFLMNLMKRSTIFRNHLIGWAIGFQIFYFLWDHYIMQIPWKGETIFTYALFVMIGMHAGLDYDTFIEKLRKRKGILIGLTILFAVLHLGNIWLHMVNVLSFGKWNSYVYNILYYGYVSLCCLSLLYVSSVVGTMKNRMVVLLNSIGATSFGIYFMHPLIIEVWRNHWMSSNSIGYPLIIFGSGLFSLLLPWFLFLTLKKYPWGWIFTGK
ncbi:MAG TPA: acyltransferase [Bacillota bacterium]|nr:acyltransferase [Bacillota bacterium]